LGLLAECFAISVYAFAVMSNHLHAVLRVEPQRLRQRWVKRGRRVLAA